MPLHKRDPASLHQVRFNPANEAKLFAALNRNSPSRVRELLAEQFAVAATQNLPERWQSHWRVWCERMSVNPAAEGLVLIAYGDATYEREWAALFDAVGEHVKQNTGIATHTYGWCGHVVHYDPKKTTEAVERILTTKSKAIVIPVLVAHDENFQIKIIGGGIAKVPDHQTRVVYRPDAILPDPSVEQWIISITSELVAKIETQPRVSVR